MASPCQPPEDGAIARIPGDCGVVGPHLDPGQAWKSVRRVDAKPEPGRCQESPPISTLAPARSRSLNVRRGPTIRAGRPGPELARAVCGALCLERSDACRSLCWVRGGEYRASGQADCQDGDVDGKSMTVPGGIGRPAIDGVRLPGGVPAPDRRPDRSRH